MPYSRNWLALRRKKLIKADGTIEIEVKYIQYEKTVPDWCAVLFPNRMYLYNDLEHANVARIWAKALFNLREQRGYKTKSRRTGWAALAKEIGLAPKPPNKKQAARNETLLSLIKE